MTLLSAVSAPAQTAREHVARALEEELQPGAVTTYQLIRYLERRITHVPRPTSEADWTREATALRRRIRDDLMRGWPPDWIAKPTRVEDAGTIGTAGSYRLRKVRYEIVPGLFATGIVCEPVERTRRAPAVVNFSGHEAAGKAAEHVQQRCITLAKMGVVVLSPEWLGFGDLAGADNAHDFAAHLDVVGANAAGLFYLSMRRALDYLASLPYVDRARLGVTGLSGGGWQSIVLGALDERVAVAVEVAGVGSLETTITHPADTEEVEENAQDLARGRDYPHLIALRAPRPTLLLHNAHDECCFRAALVKPALFDRIRPFFRLYGRERNLRWYENVDPGTHNYDADNRRAAYRFFAEHFRLPKPADERIAEGELRSEADLKVGVAAESRTIRSVARTLAARIRRAPIPPAAAREPWRQEQRPRLAEVVRYRPASVARAWPLWNARREGLSTLSHRLEFDNGLGATAVWLKPKGAAADAPLAIVLHDGGRRAAATIVAERLERGQQVLALDLLFFGEMVPEPPAPPDAEFGVSATARPQRASANYQMLLSTVGERPLGVQAGQLLAAARWARGIAGHRPVTVETHGIRSQTVALTAAALEPRAFAGVTSREAMASLRHLLDAPVTFRAAPELFCLGLYRDFDVDRLVALAAPTVVTTPSSTR